MDRCKVAVILATFNGEKYLSAQLESLVNQSCNNFICYIHDDGSSDGTRDIIQLYAEKYPKKFIELDFPICGSAKKNFWEIMKRVDADYIFFCDQDDVWHENKIEKLLECIFSLEEDMPKLVFCDMEVVDSELNIIDTSFIHYSGYDSSRIHLNELIPQNIAAGCSMVINRALKDEALRCNKSENLRMHDWWLMLVAACTGKILFLDIPLQLYRQHGDNSLGAVRDKGWNASKQRIKRFLTGVQIIQTRERILNHQKQASQLYVYYGKKVENDGVISFFSDIDKKNKAQRVYGYMHYRIFRNNKRNWWSLLCV